MQQGSLLINDEEAQPRLDMIRGLVAKPIPKAPWTDTQPTLVEGGCVYIGSKYHMYDVPNLVKLGVTAVLNCASGGISRLPMDEIQGSGIRYVFTNVRQDNFTYPILHSPEGRCSEHLRIAKELYLETKQSGGKVLFFCVAGQNRSSALAIAVLMLTGMSLDAALVSCSKTRSFILENTGFQRQLVELEKMLKTTKSEQFTVGTEQVYQHGTPIASPPRQRRDSEEANDRLMVEVELLIPGLLTMEVKIPKSCSIATVKKCLVEHVNQGVLRYSDKHATVAKSWVVLAMFGYDDMYDIPLEVEAVELSVQLQRMKEIFNLEVTSSGNEEVVHWHDRCRFAVVIFSVNKPSPYDDTQPIQEPWTFVHEERPGAPATWLENTLMSTKLRGWDFVTGESYASTQPILFCFASDPGDRRAFMAISTSAQAPQQFHAPGEGNILGMGANAIVHRVALDPVLPKGFLESNASNGDTSEKGWDAAVKRPFSLSKMLYSLENKSEAGLAKRLRFANSLNSDGRVIHFYGLGIAFSANAGNLQEFKAEAVLLARYEEEFSTYTLKRFMEDYTRIPEKVAEGDREQIIRLQKSFSPMSLKVLLVSLLNAFRDLTLMGVQAFDFNHLNNVLVSRDHRNVKLLDIDGNSQGSIQFPSEYIEGNANETRRASVHKPSLDVDLNTVLPTVVQQLFLGKGRGNAFVVNKKSEIWRAKPEVGKELIIEVIRQNFYSDTKGDEVWKAEKHMKKLSEWFYAMLKKKSPWNTWTNDIYDAMRCIDHLPIS